MRNGEFNKMESEIGLFSLFFQIIDGFLDPVCFVGPNLFW